MRSHQRSSVVFAFAVMTTAAVPLAAQVRTTQPTVINIGREVEKPGHFLVHEAVEKRWAALNRQYGYPVTYMAMTAMSGPAEVWWVSGFDGMDAWGKSTSWGSDNPAYSAALSKIAMEDGEHLNANSSIQAIAVPEAGYGGYPDLSKARVVAVTTMQVRMGMEQAFTTVAKQYAAIMKAKGVQTGWRVYSVASGLPSGTMLLFSSYPSWDAVETLRKAEDAAMAGAAPAEVQVLVKGMQDVVTSSSTRWFTISPSMSLAPKEWASDPFWAVKP